MKAKILKWTKRNDKEKFEISNKRLNEIFQEKAITELSDPAKNIDFIPMPMQRRNAIRNKIVIKIENSEVKTE